MKKFTVKDLTLISLLIALVTIFTSVVKVSIPVPAFNGYIHLGDSMIMLSGILFGPIYGMIAAGIGSMFADLLTGYAHWAIPTLIIKGCMGYLIGMISVRSGKLLSYRNILAMLAGSLWMLVGYFLVGAAMIGSFAAAWASVPFMAFQNFVGIVIFIPIGVSLRKAMTGLHLNNKTSM